jgi:hypothetical protein
MFLGRIESFFSKSRVYALTLFCEITSNPLLDSLHGESIEGIIPLSYTHFDESSLARSSGNSTDMF